MEIEHTKKQIALRARQLAAEKALEEEQHAQVGGFFIYCIEVQCFRRRIITIHFEIAVFLLKKYSLPLRRQRQKRCAKLH